MFPVHVALDNIVSAFLQTHVFLEVTKLVSLYAKLTPKLINCLITPNHYFWRITYLLNSMIFLLASKLNNWKFLKLIAYVILSISLVKVVGSLLSNPFYHLYPHRWFIFNNGMHTCNFFLYIHGCLEIFQPTSTFIDNLISIPVDSKSTTLCFQTQNHSTFLCCIFGVSKKPLLNFYHN